MNIESIQRALDGFYFSLCRMEVLGSGNQCGMPHHLLYGEYVHALIQQMGGKAVAKRMYPIAFIDPCFGFCIVVNALSGTDGHVFVFSSAKKQP